MFIGTYIKNCVQAQNIVSSMYGNLQEWITMILKCCSNELQHMPANWVNESERSCHLSLPQEQKEEEKKKI